ncbi:Pho81p SCDLUD_004537 [Saccharomycodes ludwigii]|uniref:Pho81p n=1 Tax=Saccharomycodes ludwigii TaxID=36035 RepID=UPI001E83D36E|nr:hypothetical protein SCDLUD_004537 [Saccharomycodes ludwigii]KAH3899111.1 hypothetical protein SCDLUD_004537 [Saccharomycodes ludwigii]
MKFGKYLEARQLELSEYNGYFINYKALKKLIKQLSLSSSIQTVNDTNNNKYCAITPITPDNSVPAYKILQTNKSSFFFRLERELEKVNEYYLEREAYLKVQFNTVKTKSEEYQIKGKLSSKSTTSFKKLFEALKRYQRDLDHLEQYVELNRTGFSKVLKKWDKRSHSHTKDFYLATVVSVQPIFNRNELSFLNDQSLSLLMELDEIRDIELPTDFSPPTTYASINSSSRKKMYTSFSNIARPSTPGSAVAAAVAAVTSNNSSSDAPSICGGSSISSNGMKSRFSSEPISNTRVSAVSAMLDNTTAVPDTNAPTVATTTTTNNNNNNNNNMVITNSIDIDLDIELEIESWVGEIETTCQLKDEAPKLNLLKQFPEKVILFINEDLNPKYSNNSLCISSHSDISPDHTNKNNINTTLDNKTLNNNNIMLNISENIQSYKHSHINIASAIRTALTKLFVLLIGSNKVNDKYLQTFLHACGSDKIDFLFVDDEDTWVFTKRNMFHDAASCVEFDRSFILQEALSLYSKNDLLRPKFIRFLNIQDFNGCTPLHYACELGKIDFVELLLNSQYVKESLDLIDKNSRTPLILCIVNNQPLVTKAILTSTSTNPFPVIDEDTKLQLSPLNVACIYKNYEITKIILDIMGNVDLSTYQDTQGYMPLHLAAENGADSKLLKVLVEHGADPNALDGFNKWTPLLYAAQKGHPETVRALIEECHADVTVKDEKDLSPIFYACWEGHVDVMNVLIKYIYSTLRKSSVDSTQSITADTMSTSIGNHDTTMAASVKNASNNGSIKGILPSGECASSAELLQPQQMEMVDDSMDLLDLDGIPDFSLPPPIIPLRKYGHNFLEKKIFLRLRFKTNLKSIELNKEDCMVSPSSLGRITLTSNILDIISRNISLPIGPDDDGEVVFQIKDLDQFVIDFEIYPASGTRMIAKTIMTSGMLHNNISPATNQGHAVLPLLDSRLKLVGQLMFDFQIITPFNKVTMEVTKYDTYWKSTADGGDITLSSLMGRYLTVLVTILNDGTIISAPKLTIEDKNNGCELLLLDLSQKQVELLTGKSLNDTTGMNYDIKQFISTNYVLFDKLLDSLPTNVKLDIKVAFPTLGEIEAVPVKLSSPFVNIDKFVDAILNVLFHHAQKLKESGSKREMVFSSSNHNICSILNWKQPIFPVIFNMNTIYKYNSDIAEFTVDSQNHLRHLALKKDFNTTYKEDFNYTSIKDIVNFARSNNLLGVVIPCDLLYTCEQLIHKISSSGLLLIGRGNDEHDIAHLKINGLKTDSELVFEESVL